MRISVNGVEREVTEAVTVHDVLVTMDSARPGIAVAVDGEVVRRAEWPERKLSDGAKLEILTAVQGG